MRSHDDSGRRPDAFDAASPGGTGLTPLRVGLIGYGLAGSAFHAPLVEAVPGLALASVVTSNPERGADARSAHPDAEVITSADELFNAAHAHDLVVVAAPNRHHVPLALRAVEAGLHVVVDKPLAGSAGEGRRLADAVAARGVVASVFHNRRWDGDFLTLRRLVSEGALGELLRLESRFERWRPEVDTGKWREGGGPEDAGGVLFDLGPHVIDQALELMGPARSVYAEVRALRPGARVDDDFFVALEHDSGASSQLWGTMMAAHQGPRLRALGTEAAYVKHGLDVQEEALRSGASPRDPGFGDEPPSDWGLLGAEGTAEPVATETGRYVEFYERMERAIRAAAEPPVPLSAGIETLRVIEAARRSSAERSVIPV
ncbi:MAG TPA: Gfo/Idh/MocA family oxidoreductase [Thermoleophilaceae bacterium]|nr:Gfo/Idh/MocA family oxidoreductase [Thermoleophilaceae bacterium]